MPGVVAAVVAAASWIGAQVAAVAAWTVAGIQIGSFIISSIISFGLSKLLAPKVKGNDRQADTLQLNLGENAREALFGTVATGGQLVDAADKTRYSGYDNGAEILVIKLADHEIDSLVGFYVNDEYVPWTGSGTYHAFDNSFVEGLRVYLQTGTQTQTVPSYVTTEWSSFWPTTKTMKGCAHVFVEYADTKDRDIWPAGRPRFVWVVKGAKLYDPRKDSTVSGGSGSHRWGTPSTYEWSDNAYLCRYNWVRGIFNGTHLMVGRGLTAIEAPPERAIARANTCDETVSLKAGGTEKRYRANGLVKSTDTAIDVEEWFAAAMAGDLVDRDGVVDIDPGEARTPVWTITDGDMLDGETRVYNRHLGENQRVNTVVARYVEPTQRYEAVAAPMRRDAADVTADGRPYETTLDLQFVQSGTQAQRIAEIKRRQGRLERSFQCTVGPRYIGAESGDWVTLTSDRWLGGDSIVCVITAVQIGVDFKVTLGLREIASSVYSWTAASDELTPGTVVASSTSAPAAISVTSFAAAAAVLTTAAGSVPAIQCTWAAFTDASVTGVLLQVRKSGETTITPTTMSDATVLEAFVTAGVGAQQAMQVRAKAISNVPGRKSNWTSWTNVTTGGSTIDNAQVGVGSNGVVNSEFENGIVGWTAGYDGNTGFTPTRGRNAVAGKYGALNVLSATITGTPANGTVFAGWAQAGWSGAPPGLAALRRYGLAVKAGDRVFCSALYAYENLDSVQALILWWDKAGSYLGASFLSPAGGTSGGATDGAPANFTEIGGFDAAPTNAAYATHYTRAYCNGGANPKAYMARPMLAIVPAGQTAWPKYTPGPSDKWANATQDNSARGLLANALIAQGSGGPRQLMNSVGTFETYDGQSVTFPVAYPVAPKVRALTGGKAYETTLTNSQYRAISLVASTTGFTVSDKLKEAVGTVTAQTQSTWTTVSANRSECDKPTSADAWNGFYTIAFTARVYRVYVDEGFYEGTVTLTAYTNDGGGWVARGSRTISDSDSTAGYFDFTESITFAAGAIGQHGGKEFALEITYESNASSSIQAMGNLTYGTATAPAQAAGSDANFPARIMSYLGDEAA